MGDDGTTADLDRVDFSHNSAADGGAVFVNFLGTVSLSRVMMRHNYASGNGGAMSVGTGTSVALHQLTATRNVAEGSGGALYLSGFAKATLRSIDASDNEAKISGGAVAISDSLQSAATCTSSVIRRNTAGRRGGGFYVQDSRMSITGVQWLENSVQQGNGGGLATSGTATSLELSDTPCVEVDVLLDWTAAGDGCFASFIPNSNFIDNCQSEVHENSATCAETDASAYPGYCDGCPCNDE